MFNKKTIAVALAAAFSTNTFANIALDAPGGVDSELVTYATEVVTTTTEFETVVNNNALLNIETKLGFSVGANEPKYIRFDFTNAKLSTTVVGTMLTIAEGGVASPVVTLASGGQVGDSFVVFEITASEDFSPGADVTLALPDLSVSTTSKSSVEYGLYEGSTAAANKTGLTLKSATKSVSEFASGSTGEFVALATDQQATVNSSFKSFAGASMGSTTASIGAIDAGLLVGNAFDLAGEAVTAEQLLEDQTISFTGDFTFGTWTIENSADCAGAVSVDIIPVPAGGGVTRELTASEIASSEDDNWYICVDTGTDTILKSEYTVSLDENELTGDLGTISYDTTTIEVPYLTTFSEYNQRLYIINNGSSPADYSISFVGESMTTATPLAGATGTVPAGEMLMLKVTDIVELEGRTRVSATVEVEGIDANIQAATQTVNLADGTTDTVVLNANSITSPSN